MNSNVWRLEAWLLGQSNINQQVNLARDVSWRFVLSRTDEPPSVLPHPRSTWQMGLWYLLL